MYGELGGVSERDVAAEGDGCRRDDPGRVNGFDFNVVARGDGDA